MRDEDEPGQLTARRLDESTQQVEYAPDHFVATSRSDAVQTAPATIIPASSANSKSSPVHSRETILQRDQEVSPLQVAAHSTVPLGVSLMALYVSATALRPGQGTNNKISFLGFLASFVGIVTGALNAFADFTHASYATSTTGFFLPLSFGAAGLGLGFLGRTFHKEIIENLGDE